MVKLKKLTAVMLALALLLCTVPVTLATDVDPMRSALFTRGDARNLAFDVAKRYNPNAELETMMVGDGKGDLRLNDSLTNAEAAVLLKRAFGVIGQAVGNNKRMADPDANIENIPGWAVVAYEDLKLGGILSGQKNANEIIDKREFTLMLDRLMRLYGNNPKDEFYESINKAWLDTSVFPEGRGVFSMYAEIDERTVVQLEAILDELAVGTYQNGTPEYYVSEFYKNALNKEARNAAGIAPLKKYLDAINNVNNIEDLIRVHSEIYDGTGRGFLFGFEFGADIRDSSKNTLFFGGPEIYLTKDDYDTNNRAHIEAFAEYVTKMLALSGENEPKTQAEQIVALEKELALSMLTPQEEYDVEVAYKESNLAKLDAMFKTINIVEAAEAAGVQAAADTRVLIYQPEAVVTFADLLTEENLEVWKTYLKVSLLRKFSTLLSQDFIDAADEFNKATYGIEEPVTYKRRAIDWTCRTLGEYLGQIYIKKHFSEDTKRDIEQMVVEFIEQYRETLSENTWLSPETRDKALKKLDTLDYKIGYPDKWNDFLNGADIGDNFFDSVCVVKKAVYDDMIKKQTNPPDRTAWIMNVYEVNAYYNPPYNEIVFPAGILQAPFYEPNAMRAANLGGIGYTIAHEISHAFDDNGAQFDEKGNAISWWTAEDYAEFERRCQDVIRFYDGLEIAPGIFSDGVMTLGENIADFEGLLCTVAVAKKDPDVDLKVLFESLARSERCILTRGMAKYYNVADVHSNGRIRVNRTIQNVPEFYEVYDVKEGDGMFVPAAERVKIW